MIQKLQAFMSGANLGTYGVSIYVMTRIFRGKITRKIWGGYKEIPNFSGNFTPKNLGHGAD